MDIHIHIEKRHLVFLVVFVSVLFVAGVAAYVNPITHVGHGANETGPGTFGAGNFGFPGHLNVSGDLNVSKKITTKDLNATGYIILGGVPRDEWPPNVSNLSAANITAGIFGDNFVDGNFGFPSILYFPNDAPNNGIWWMSSSRDPLKPHIDYSSTTGLWISGGAGNVHIDGDLVANNTNVTGNLTLGGKPRDSWPSVAVVSQLPARNITNGTFGNGDYTFPDNLSVDTRLTVPNASVANLSAGNLTVDDRVVARNISVADANVSNYLLAKNITVINMTVKGNMTLGGIPRDEWPSNVSNLSAVNITAGTFGVNVGGGNFSFPWNVNISNLLTVKNITVINMTVTGNLTLGGEPRDSWPDSGWKLLLEASEESEEGLTTIGPSGVSYVLSSAYSDPERMNFGKFDWPTDQPKKILFKVKNYNDFYGVGGDGRSVINGGSKSSKCTDFYYSSGTLNKVSADLSPGGGKDGHNWAQLYINGKLMVGCPDLTGLTPNPGYPGKCGEPYGTVFCIYETSTHWTGDLTSLKVETADWSSFTSQWNWEIWYK